MTTTETATPRIWQEADGTVHLRDTREILRGDDTWAPMTTEVTYWVPLTGGYVRAITDQTPGTLGDQVCRGLAGLGPTLWATRETLLSVIKREDRRGRMHMHETSHGR